MYFLNRLPFNLLRMNPSTIDPTLFCTNDVDHIRNVVDGDPMTSACIRATRTGEAHRIEFVAAEVVLARLLSIYAYNVGTMTVSVAESTTGSFTQLGVIEVQPDLDSSYGGFDVKLFDLDDYDPSISAVQVIRLDFNVPDGVFRVGGLELFSILGDFNTDSSYRPNRIHVSDSDSLAVRYRRDKSLLVTDDGDGLVSQIRLGWDRLPWYKVAELRALWDGDDLYSDGGDALTIMPDPYRYPQDIYEVLWSVPFRFRQTVEYSYDSGASGEVVFQSIDTAIREVLRPTRLVAIDNGIETRTFGIPAGAPLVRVPVPFQVQVFDQFDNPLRGVAIRFMPVSGSDPYIDLSDGIVRTNSQGLASSYGLNVTLPASGVIRVIAEVVGIELDHTFSMSVASQSPAFIEIISGNAQTGFTGRALNPLVVRVLDSQRDAVEGQEVVWSTSTGDFSESSVMTDADGMASSVWTLGTITGTQTARASIGVLNANFTATAIDLGSLMLEKISGDNQLGLFGYASLLPLAVRTRDSMGDVIGGVPITWSVSGGGMVDPGTGITGPAGSDDFGVLRTGTVTLGASGAQTFTATITGTSTAVTFTLTGFDRAPHSITYGVRGVVRSAITIGNTFDFPFRVFDRLGNLYAGASVDVSILSEGEDYARVVQTPVVTDSNGVGNASVLGTAVGRAVLWAQIPAPPASIGESVVSWIIDVDEAVPTYLFAFHSGLRDTRRFERLNAASDPLIVQFLDQHGGTVVGQDIDWEVISGTATLPASTRTTTSEGGLTQIVVMPTVAGGLNVRATSVDYGFTADFVITVLG